MHISLGQAFGRREGIMEFSEMAKMRVICIVAPYAPVGTSFPNLGAARKLETYISILGDLASKIILINTAHNLNNFSGRKISKCKIAGVEVIEISPPQLPHRQLGKLAQLFYARSLAKKVQRDYQPELTWLYNGYAFECIFGKYIGGHTSSAIFLEFEDWHFARKRNLSLKPAIDYYFWRRLAPSIKHAFCVNDYLANKLNSLGAKTTVIPGLIPDEIAALSISAPPFRKYFSEEFAQNLTIGYFGGLSSEKGASLILELVESNEINCKYIVCGGGELLNDFKKLAIKFPDTLSVSSKLSFDEMVVLMSECDILLNPHKVSKNFIEGVFPSKVLEAIGSGRMVISTALPEIADNQILEGVLFCDDTSLSFRNCLREAQAHYKVKADVIKRAANIAVNKFGTAAVKEKIRIQLEGGEN